ncbi:uncharacterized protein F5891DRAFT_980827 [Suillus fuscotomentosus]|uniref:Uncharacterized protein n=1 Tax=Suillus fuscotomentosus TaxID=1912939 RepID=A0AAD4E7J2_9AGAM|nr:uncharacterized protein F5891DRAFT_980827 [Suillus fuscotomentosus]KAG1899884.1 hypothetical protein F5891DRAFT_980827 [Suillus fuscotomentosus]
MYFEPSFIDTIQLVTSTCNARYLFISYLNDKGEVPRCPTCPHGPVKEQDLIEVLRSSGQDSSHQESTGDEKEGTSTSEVFLRRNEFRSSTKQDALVPNLILVYVPSELCDLDFGTLPSDATESYLPAISLSYEFPAISVASSEAPSAKCAPISDFDLTISGLMVGLHMGREAGLVRHMVHQHLLKDDGCMGLFPTVKH